MNPEEESPKSRAKPVKVYLIIMFSVFFLLLLLTFFMQQRNNQALEDLNASVNNVQDVSELRLENQRLTFALEKAEMQQKETAEQVEALEQQAKALEWLRQLQAALRTSTGAAQEMLKNFQETGLPEVLSNQPLVEGTISPKETYNNICKLLGNP